MSKKHEYTIACKGHNFSVLRFTNIINFELCWQSEVIPDWAQGSKISTSFKLLLISIFFIFTGSSCQFQKQKTLQKPNIILIFTDQQNAGTFSAAGNPDLETPSIDMLAEQGVLFKHAYCSSPVCGPSRSSIVSGLMPHETGVEWNGQSMHGHIVTSGEIFRENGYQTVWGGKWHLPEAYPQRNAARNNEAKGFELLPFYDQNRKRWFLGSDTDAPLTEAVVNYLENYDKEKPLFLAVSYHNPHDICMYPRKAGWFTEQDSLLEIRHYGFKYKLPDVIGTYPGEYEQLPPLPPNYDIQEDEPGFISEKRVNHDEYGVETKLANQEFGDLEWKGYLNAYYRLTEMVDKEIGKVLNALKENGYWNNSLVIFTSDHGDGAAAHKWAAKLSLYEESAKIPMIVSWPGKTPSGVVDKEHLVSVIDILPTMIDYAGIETETILRGKSMKQIIDKKPEAWRDFLVVELADYKKNKSRKGRMVRHGDYKYNIYSSGEEQLFNIEEDPGEIQNLISEPALQEIRSRSRTLLLKWAEETDDSFATELLRDLRMSPL